MLMGPSRRAVLVLPPEGHLASGSRISGAHPKPRFDHEAPAHARRRHSGATPPLWFHDVRLTRELAHRRFVMSLFRRVMRLVTLHALDTLAVCAAAAAAAWLTEMPDL